MVTTESLPRNRVMRAVTVSRVPLPDDAQALSDLARFDYTDAFIVDAGVDRTPEEWINAMLRDTPLAVRAQLVAGWTALGLKLGAPWSQSGVLGWRVQRNDPRVLLLTAGSRFGLQGQLLARSLPGGLLFATFVQLHNPVARTVWSRITPHHQHVVGSLLHQAGRRLAQREDSAAGSEQVAHEPKSAFARR